LPITIAIIFGIIFFFYNSIFLLPIFLLLLIIFCFHIHTTKKYVYIFLSLICFAFGYFFINHHYNSYETFWKKIKRERLKISCIISDIQRISHTFHPWHITAQIKTLKNLENSAFDFAKNKYIVMYSKTSIPFQVGDEIQLHNISMATPKDSSFKIFGMKNTQIGSVFFNPNNNTSKLINRPDFSLSRMIWSYRTHCYNSLLKKLSPQTKMLFSTLFFGNKNNNKNRYFYLKQRYKYWGISHYLARSGLHMTTCIVLWTIILNMFSLPMIIKNILLLFLSLIYLLLTWPSISFIRAALFALIFKLGIIFRRSPMGLHVLTIITLGTILHNPILVCCLDFQLSFGLTFGLIWLFHVLRHKKRCRA